MRPRATRRHSFVAQGLTARSKQETSQFPLSPDSPWFHQLVLRAGRVESSRGEGPDGEQLACFRAAGPWAHTSAACYPCGCTQNTGNLRLAMPACSKNVCFVVRLPKVFVIQLRLLHPCSCPASKTKQVCFPQKNTEQVKLVAAPRATDPAHKRDVPDVASELTPEMLTTKRRHQACR